MYNGKEYAVLNMAGGQASNVPFTLLKQNQAISVDNVYATPAGGIAKRRGDDEFNAVAMVNGSTAIHGLAYMKFISGTETLLAVAGTKLFKSDSLSGTMTDITGAVTITTGADNIWQSFKYGDKIVFVGGAPDAPLVYNGSGNAAALGGSPPSGHFGFQHNNRGFIGSTAAAPSTLYWSIVSDVENWTGTGSGSIDIWSGDGDKLVGAAVLTTDIILAFKQSSIHQVIATEAPFPSFPLFSGIGACGKNAIVTHQGMVYFVTPQRRMKATDGAKIIDFPPVMDDVWDTIIANRLQFVQGIHYQSTDHNLIIWAVSTSSSSQSDTLLIWDLTHQSWWRYSTGYNTNVFAKTLAGTLYGGHYNGKIFKKDTSGQKNDESTSTGVIRAKWQWGWQTNESLQESIRPFRLNVSLAAQTSGTIRVGYGFDFNTDQRVQDLTMASSGMDWDSGTNDGDEWDLYDWADQTDLITSVFVRGRGNAFQVTFSNGNSSETFKINHFTISGKPSGQKVFAAK